MSTSTGLAGTHPTALITDSTCDIPDELLARYDIAMVPLFLIWGDEVMRDRVDVTPTQFYSRLRSDPRMPKTSHCTPEDLRQAYETARAAGAKEAVVVTISSAMSGTYNAALLAAEGVDLPVSVVDAKGPCMSVGWAALAAARAREAGGDARAMVAAAERARQGMAQWVSLDTLEYLHKGGRIGNATRLLGTLLSIKPLIYLNHTTGLVESGPLVRSRRKSVEALYDSFFGQLAAGLEAQPEVAAGQSLRLRVAVLHGDAPDEAAELAARIESEHHPTELIVTITSPTLGVHTGPRALALCGYYDLA